MDPDGESATGAVLTWISGDAVIPELTDLAVWKWVGYGAIIIGAAVLDLSIGRVFSNQQKRDIDNVDDPDEWPENPDNWIPPQGVKEEEKTREKTGDRHRQWKDEEGNIVRRWDAGGREAGKERGPHWHDSKGNHVKPGGGLDK